MTDEQQKQLGKTLWAIADQRRGAMNADDVLDDMPTLMFLRHLTDDDPKGAHE